MHDGKTCVEAGYEDITSLSECESAFDSVPEHPGKQTKDYEVGSRYCSYARGVLARSGIGASHSSYQLEFACSILPAVLLIDLFLRFCFRRMSVPTLSMADA